jgi:hypothetical protein
MPLPTIAIVGSYRPEIVSDLATRERAEQAAADIGEALAAEGFGLYVYSSKRDFVEALVVSGYLRSKPMFDEATITFCYPGRSKGAFQEEGDAEKARYFRRLPSPDDDWINAFYSSLYRVDGLVILGGGYSSLVAGHICLGRGVPVLPIAAFDGSAREVWRYMARDQRLRELAQTDTLAYWNSESATVCARNLRVWHEQIAAERQRAIHTQALLEQKLSSWEKDQSAEHRGRRNSLLALTLLAVFVATLLTGLLMKSADDGFKIAFIVGLLCAGASGSTCRLLMPGAPATSRISTLVLGAVAGLVLSLFYLLPQFVSGGVLTLETWPADKLAASRYQFLSAMLFAFVSGVGFDLIADRFRKAAGENAEKVPLMPGGSI